MGYLVNCWKYLFGKVINRMPNFTFDASLFNKVYWVCDNKDLKHKDIDFRYEDIDEKLLREALDPILKLINHRHDCADFRCLQLIKFVFTSESLLNKYPELKEEIKQAILNFKFWITSPGEDSMCYYSENHQTCFVACEFLGGMMYPDEIFSIDGLNGKAHMEIARKRFRDWYELRNRFSYSEFYSSNYMPVNLTSLSMISTYSNDEEMKRLADKEMTTILTFYATTIFEGTLINASGRDYSRNMMNCTGWEPNSRMIIDTVFGDQNYVKNTYYSVHYTFYSNYRIGKYKLDQKIVDLAKKDEIITKRKFGLALDDYKKEGLLGGDDKSIMMRLGSGTTTNPEIIDATIKMMHDHKHIYASDFLHWMYLFEFPNKYKKGKMGEVSRKLDFYNNRMALMDSNVYTYRGQDYKISCQMGYYPGSIGAQKNTIVATLRGGVTVYTTHPMVDANKKRENYKNTPSYFGGYCTAPHAVADKNVGLVIYDIPLKRRFFMFHKILKFTHAYFPTELMNEYKIDGRYAFGNANGSYIALIGLNEFSMRDPGDGVFKTTYGSFKDRSKFYDLLQNGLNTYWIYELSSDRVETFDEFMNRIKNNYIKFENDTLEYNSKEKYKLTYNGKFFVNDKEIDTKYEYDFGGKYE